MYANASYMQGNIAEDEGGQSCCSEGLEVLYSDKLFKNYSDKTSQATLSLQVQEHMSQDNPWDQSVFESMHLDTVRNPSADTTISK